MKNKMIKKIIAAVVVVGVALGGFYFYSSSSSSKTASATTQYIEKSVTTSNLEVSVQGTGAAYSGSTKEVTVNNAGEIDDLSVKVGDTVTKGQKLFVSDSDQLTSAVTTAQNNLTKQQLQLEADQSADQVDDNKIAQDKLNVSDAKTALADAKAAVTKMTVKAPIAGVVTVVNNIDGDNVQANAAVLTIVDMTDIKVKVSVDELDINKVSVGQSADVQFDAIDGKTYTGTVESIAQTGTSSNNVTTYDVVVSVSNPENIKIGMNASVEIKIQSKENAVVIPAEALVETDGKKYVRVKGTDSGEGTLTEITTGLETEDYIEVTTGVTEGQAILIKMTTSSSTTSTSNDSLKGMGNMGGGMQQGSGTAPTRPSN